MPVLCITSSHFPRVFSFTKELKCDFTAARKHLTKQGDKTWSGQGGPMNYKGNSKVEFFEDTVAFSCIPGIKEQGLRLPSLLSQGWMEHTG